MRRFLPLPSPTILQKMLQNIPMDTGVTDDTRKRLAEAMKLCKTEKDMGRHVGQSFSRIRFALRQGH